MKKSSWNETSTEFPQFTYAIYGNAVPSSAFGKRTLSRAQHHEAVGGTTKQPR
jgi:hypothetical protein